MFDHVLSWVREDADAYVTALGATGWGLLTVDDDENNYQWKFVLYDERGDVLASGCAYSLDEALDMADDYAGKILNRYPFL